MVEDNGAADSAQEDTLGFSNHDELIRPMSRQAFLRANIGGPSEVVESDAYQLIERRLVRFLDGYERGFSILLSALRGMGKTTNVLHILNKYQREEDARYYRARPLPIELDAPTIYFAYEAKLAETERALAENGERFAEQERKRHEDLLFRQVFLEQLTTNLYRSFCRELVSSFEEKQREIAQSSNNGRLRFPELLGHLNLSLMNTAEVGVYRKIWQQAGVMERGILFKNSDKYCPPDSRIEQRESRLGRAIEEENQGVKEITAIAALTRSFRKLAGKFEVSSSYRQSNEKNQVTGVASEMKPAEVLAGISMLGATVIGSQGQALPALITALSSLVFFTFSVNQTARQNRLKEEALLFEPDTGPASLSRDIPYILSCISRCGLAPVFIIDELDKLQDDQLDRMLDKMTLLKHIITEKACFIYLGSLRAATVVHGKDAEAGVFSSLFKVRTQLCYKADNVIPWMFETMYETKLKGGGHLEEVAQLWAMVTILTCRMSMLKINQALWAFREAQRSSDEKYLLPAIALDDDGTWHHVAMYAAIEVVLNNSRNRVWFGQDPLAEVYAREAIYFTLEVWDVVVDRIYAGDNNIGVRQMMFNGETSEFKADSVDTRLPKRLLVYLGKRIDVDVLNEMKLARETSKNTWFKPLHVDNLVYNVLEVFDYLCEPQLLLNEMKKHYQSTRRSEKEHWLVKRIRRRFMSKDPANLTAPLCVRNDNQDVEIQFDRAGVSFGQFEFNADKAKSQLSAINNALHLLESYVV